MQDNNLEQTGNSNFAPRYDSRDKYIQSDSCQDDVVLNNPSGATRDHNIIVGRDNEAIPPPLGISMVQSWNPNNPEASLPVIPAAILPTFPMNVSSDRNGIKTQKDQTPTLSDPLRRELLEISPDTCSVVPGINSRFTTQSHVQTKVRSNFPPQQALSMETPKKPHNPSSNSIPNTHTPLARKASNL
ncbi:hypothetical protein BGZ60DRAFT_397579 [Tricladium varicosporioides]|nr:hypothetical protein BGZ60DRAFT_397579 [Hymenoscyphus varicosporioides]